MVTYVEKELSKSNVPTKTTFTDVYIITIYLNTHTVYLNRFKLFIN